MQDQIRYFRFVALFVDAVTTEPLVRTLRERHKPTPIRTASLRRAARKPTPMPQAA